MEFLVLTQTQKSRCVDVVWASWESPRGHTRLWVCICQPQCEETSSWYAKISISWCTAWEGLHPCSFLSCCFFFMRRVFSRPLYDSLSSHSLPDEVPNCFVFCMWIARYLRNHLSFLYSVFIQVAPNKHPTPLTESLVTSVHLWLPA